VTGLLNDLRYGARALRRAPGFTLVATLTLALGIGANAAMFGVVDALLFRPPARVADPGRLVRVQTTMPTPPGEPAELSSVLSYPAYTDSRDRARGFAGVAAYSRTTVTVGDGDEGRSEQALLATGNYFALLGVRPALGRSLAVTDDHQDAPVPSAVVSWDYWQRALSADPAAVGSSITINGRPFTVVGVAPKYFVGTELGAPAFWLPLATAPSLGYDARMTRSRYAAWLSVVGRLAPGVSREQAQASAQGAVLSALDEGADPPAGAGLGAGPTAGEVRIAIRGPGGAPGRRAPVQVKLARLAGGQQGALPGPMGPSRALPVSLWFLAVTAAVLLIACANVANLLLARAANRAHELAVRLSIGATLGAAAGLLLAVVGVALLPRVIPLPPLPPLLDARVLLFTTALTAATTLAFGLAPALRAGRADLNVALAGSGRGRASRSVGRNTLVVVQLAASVVLLVGAGLFVRSLRNVQAIDTGFAAERLLLASVDLRGSRMTREQADEFWRRALERVLALPGVRAAALGAMPPFEMMMMMPAAVPGRPTPDGRPLPAQTDFADANYFATLGIRLVQGRPFTEADRDGAAPVAIVNEALARRFWGGESPLGQCIRLGDVGSDASCHEVVGVAADARYSDITQAAGPFFYRPRAQRPPTARPMTVMHVRTAGDPAASAGAVRQALQGIDAAVPFVNVRPLVDLIRPQALPWRIGTLLFTLFGALGMVLAAVGLYGVISFLVAQRTREVGVRIALGAQRRDVLALVLGQGARLIVAGVATGALAAAAAARLFASMMYGVSGLDPLVYAATALVLGTVALFATWVPARRATRVDPMVALRAE